MKELKVGERITLEAVESPTGKGCCFTDLDFSLKDVLLKSVQMVKI